MVLSEVQAVEPEAAQAGSVLYIGDGPGSKHSTFLERLDPDPNFEFSP